MAAEFFRLALEDEDVFLPPAVLSRLVSIPDFVSDRT